jgi:hypothetical protein
MKEKTSILGKPTLLDLYRKHASAMNNTLFEIPDVQPIAVLYLFVFQEATMHDAECVLDCFNRLAQTHYTFDDLATVNNRL